MNLAKIIKKNLVSQTLLEKLDHKLGWPVKKVNNYALKQYICRERELTLLYDSV